jgi:hypothetical protein
LPRLLPSNSDFSPEEIPIESQFNIQQHFPMVFPKGNIPLNPNSLPILDTLQDFLVAVHGYPPEN